MVPVDNSPAVQAVVLVVQAVVLVVQMLVLAVQVVVPRRGVSAERADSGGLGLVVKAEGSNVERRREILNWMDRAIGNRIARSVGFYTSDPIGLRSG